MRVKTPTTESKKGFTLVELLIVVAIIIILLGVATPTINVLINRAQYERINATTTVANNAYTRHILAKAQKATTLAEANTAAQPYLRDPLPQTLPYAGNHYPLQFDGEVLFYLGNNNTSPGAGQGSGGGAGQGSQPNPTPAPTPTDPELPDPNWQQQNIPIFTGDDNIVTRAIEEMLAQDFPGLATTEQLEILQQATIAYAGYLQNGPQNQDRINYLAQLATANGLQTYQIEQAMQLANYDNMQDYLRNWTGYDSYEMAAMSAYSQWPNYKGYAFDIEKDDPVQWVRDKWNSPTHYSWLPPDQRRAAALQDISYQPSWQGNMTATNVTDVINHIGQATPQLIALATLNPNLNAAHKQELVNSAATYLKRSDLPAQTRIALEDSIGYLLSHNPALASPEGF